MYFKFIIFVIAFTLARSNDLDCECGIGQGKGKTRIVNGNTVGLNTYPWMVALMNIDTGRQFCGGTLINDRWILTAAHCVPDLTPDKLLVIASTVSLDKVYQENALQVDYIWSNPSYLGKTDYHHNDIALLRLSNPVKFSNKLSPICLPNANQMDFDNLFYMGWGKVGVGKQASNDLLYIDTMPSDDCYRVFYPGFEKDKQFCTQAEGKGICDGDSGGPLSSKVNGHVTQVGINSYVALGTCGEKPDVTTRVSAFLDDIYSVTDGSNWCRNPNKN